MAKSDLLRKDHQKLLGIVNNLKPMLSASTAGQKASEIKALLSQLAGTIQIHLAMEDKMVYQQMLSNPSTKAIAERFQREMGGIASAFTGYITKYNTANAISANPSAFIADTEAILSALGKRITREESELYPAFDKT